LEKQRDASRLKARAARWALVSDATLLLLKGMVAFATGSIGVLAEVVNSAGDLMGAFIVYLSVRASELPPDETHAYGHGKIENLSGAATASLIITGGAYAGFQAVMHLIHPEVLPNQIIGLAVMAFSAILNFLVSSHLLKVARLTDSPALEADGHHLRTDVYTSVGVLVGLLLSWATHNPRWDAVAALLVSLLILKVGYELALSAVMTLSDHSLPPNEEKMLTDILRAHPAVLSFHRLRTRKSGSQRHADVHVQIADSHTFVEAHRLTEDIEDQMRMALPNLDPVIHMEPHDDELAHQLEQHAAEISRYRGRNS
jgi:cation diffusion facilitator family transporter